MASVANLASLAALLLLLLLTIRAVYRSLFAAQRLPQGVPILGLSPARGAKGHAQDARAFALTSHNVIQKGYDDYSSKGINYLLRTPDGLVFIAAPQFVDDIKAAPDDKLDPMPINNSTLQVAHTLHPALSHSWYEFDVVKKQLTHALGSSLPHLLDECRIAFARELGEPTEWQPVVMGEHASRIVTRTANRIFFGADLAANEDFLRLSTSYTNVVFGGAHVIRQYPRFLAPLVVRAMTNVTEQKAIASRFLEPLLKQRMAAMASDKSDREDTLVQWIIDLAPPHERRDLPLLTQRLMHIVVSAVHTSAVSFLDMIYELAMHPEIHAQLREEIVAVFDASGHAWSKQALSKLVKLDSFMRETARHHPFLTGSVERYAVTDFTLHDGTVIPRGIKVSVPQYGMNRDAAIYGSDAHDFDAFRFSRMRNTPGQELNHSYVQTSSSFIHFGHGKHACPGRFFASNEIKVLLIHLLDHYDVRWHTGQAKPQPGWYGGYRVADMSVPVELRSRETQVLPL